MDRKDYNEIVKSFANHCRAYFIYGELTAVKNIEFDGNYANHLYGGLEYRRHIMQIEKYPEYIFTIDLYENSHTNFSIYANNGSNNSMNNNSMNIKEVNRNEAKNNEVKNKECENKDVSFIENNTSTELRELISKRPRKIASGVLCPRFYLNAAIDRPALTGYFDDGRVRFVEYWRGGSLHNESGPAVIDYGADGKFVSCAFWLNGKNGNANDLNVMKLNNLSETIIQSYEYVRPKIMAGSAEHIELLRNTPIKRARCHSYCFMRDGTTQALYVITGAVNTACRLFYIRDARDRIIRIVSENSHNKMHNVIANLPSSTYFGYANNSAFWNTKIECFMMNGEYCRAEKGPVRVDYSDGGRNVNEYFSYEPIISSNDEPAVVSYIDGRLVKQVWYETPNVIGRGAKPAKIEYNHNRRTITNSLYFEGAIIDQQTVSMDPPPVVNNPVVPNPVEDEILPDEDDEDVEEEEVVE